MAKGLEILAEPERIETRSNYQWALLFSLIAFLVILFRFFTLQVISGDKYQKLATINHIGSERIPARRGMIKDRQGRILAKNIDTHHLSVIPHYLKNPDEELLLLRDLLAWTNEEFDSIKHRISVASEREKQFNRIVIQRDLTAAHCPFDHGLLELREEVEFRWCAECGRRYESLLPDQQKCSHDKKKLTFAADGMSAACQHCGTEYVRVSTCPHDHNVLRERTTNLVCPICKRNFDNQVAMIVANLHLLPGVYLNTEMRREYPYRNRVSHVLGYMNEVNADDMEMWPGVYRPGDFIGRTGIERAMEDVLRGKNGRDTFVKDQRGAQQESEELKAIVAELKGQPAIGGDHVWLTIDTELQRIVKDAFRYQKSGAVVAMDPMTGEVLAMYSKPGFDPNVWSGRLTGDVKKEYDNNYYAPLINKALTAYAPGSIFKPVTALAGLREGEVTHKSAVTCPGYYEFGGRRFRCHNRGGHGENIDLVASLMLSCDIYYYKLGEVLGMDRLERYARDVFLLGHETGIELPERSGRVPSKEWYRKYAAIGWQPGFTLSVSVGQGALTTTPVQMARMYSALVNGGVLYRPYIVRQLEDENGNITRRFRPEVQAQLPFDEQQIRLIEEGLIAVVNDPENGTAYSARLEDVVMAGKTGTAEAKVLQKGVPDDVAAWYLQDHAWFVGYAPVTSPQIVVVVFVEHGGGGGKVAAPVAQRVIDQFFKKGLGTLPTNHRVQEGDHAEHDHSDAGVPERVDTSEQPPNVDSLDDLD